MMVHIVSTGVAPEPQKPVASEHCREIIASLERRLRERPNYRPDRATALALAHPACDFGCTTCYMACAIAPERLAWWRNELALAEAYEAGAVLQHHGALFLSPAGRA